MRTFFLVFSLLLYSICFGQQIQTRLSDAFKIFAADDQCRHSLISLYIVNSKTGKIIFDKNSQIGLAPASCLKVFTSAAAFELLGKDYRYKTDFGYDGTIEDSILNGNLFILASGDPTLGSWRWEDTKEEAIQQKLVSVLKEKNVTTITGDINIDDSRWETQTTPRGWTWEDIGNYYGAGARGLNWHENQYDLILKPGKKVGDAVEIVTTKPQLFGAGLFSELKTGKEGSGDNSIIYLPEGGLVGYVRGTVPVSNGNFKVSGSLPTPSFSFRKAITGVFNENGIRITQILKTNFDVLTNKEKTSAQSKFLLSLHSPPLDSINYWFLQKSINLYGEAFVKTIAYEKTGFGATDSGINIIKDFWSKKGIEKSALNMIDGSGLSPANRVTTHALVKVMQYARQQNWYSSFYNALPEQNGVKMKSGYIAGVRSYTGYVKSKSGAEYTFSFIINNFDGSPGAVREKMWKLLDILKAP